MSDRMNSVAIDGPAGAGKSTIAKAAAKRFGFIYVDTGAIYRTVGLAARRTGIDPHSKEAVMEMLPKLSIRFDYDADGIQRMYLNDEDVSAEIRTPEMSMYASAVSAIAEVREYLMEMQRSMARTQSVVMDGRDIGTVVLPNARLKIFLTAAPEARAERRLAELREKGVSASFDEVLSDMIERDKNDTNRAAAPLRAAEDSVLVDTTALTLEESIETICGLMAERFGSVNA